MKKKLLVLGILPFLLTGCDFANYKEVTKEEFVEEADKANDKALDERGDGTLYTDITIKGSKESTSNGVTKKVEFNVNYKLKETEFGTEFVTTETNEEILAVTDSYYYYTTGTYFFADELVEYSKDERKYYVGNGFKIEGEFSSTVTFLNATSSGSSTYEFNKYGVLTKLYSDTTTSMDLGSGKIESHDILSFTVSHK